MRFRSSLGLAVVVPLAFVACRAPAEAVVEEAPKGVWSEAALSRDGRAIELFAIGEGPPTVLILASIHGNEAAGTPLVMQLVERIEADPGLLDGGRAILVPNVNPDGVAARTRGNANGVDLNRNFPAENWNDARRHGSEPLSEPESRAILEMVERHRPDRIVSIHQPLSTIDFDGPGDGLAAAMAEASPFGIRRLGARPGSLGSWAGVDQGIPIVTVELPRRADEATPDELWELYGPMLLAALRYREPAPAAD